MEVDKKDWEEEKERVLALSKEEKRKELKAFVPLEEVNTWAKDEAYLSKKGEKLSDDEKEKLNSKLLKNFNIDEQVDLSEKVSVWEGDITKLEIDAIVNAANESLLGGGGVDGAIHRAAGPNLLKENKTLGGCPTGEARISGGYRLPARYVISTVGPRGENPELLENAYKNSLACMAGNKLKSIAFPCISTGVYGYPNDRACEVALKTVRKFLEKHHEEVDRVIFCLFLPVDIGIYKKMMPIIFPSVASKL